MKRWLRNKLWVVLIVGILLVMGSTMRPGRQVFEMEVVSQDGRLCLFVMDTRTSMVRMTHLDQEGGVMLFSNKDLIVPIPEYHHRYELYEE